MPTDADLERFVALVESGRTVDAKRWADGRIVEEQFFDDPTQMR